VRCRRNPSPSARATLERRRKTESDPEVRAEMEAALAAAAGDAPDARNLRSRNLGDRNSR